jgi:hydroxyacylglutathione hydrolase
MNLIPLPAFSDNYIWLLHHHGKALVVDPGDSQPVLDTLAALDLALDLILITHHHADHTGGLSALTAATKAKMYGPAKEKMPASVIPLTQGDCVTWCGVDFQVQDVPGHTSGHIAYWGQPEGMDPILFCGDTLFSGGCGRLFEGTASQMLDSLDKLSAFPGATQVCCAHEYTLSNLKFAKHVEPSNQTLIQYDAHCQSMRAQGIPTLPSRIDIELKINPFLRSRHKNVRTSVQNYQPTSLEDAAVFAALREWKNEFK